MYSVKKQRNEMEEEKYNLCGPYSYSISSDYAVDICKRGMNNCVKLGRVLEC